MVVMGQTLEHFTSYNPIFKLLEDCAEKSKHTIVAIDGNAASGKSTLAEFIKEHFDCNVFHMDDFFLPMSMKTKERLQEPGGNVDYDRFLHSVLKPLHDHEVVYYQPFNCQTQTLGEVNKIQPKKLNIVEGVYSMHPILYPYYTHSIFLSVDPDVQLERIAKRNEQKVQQFITQWLPLENRYFDYYQIKSKCQLFIGTGGQVPCPKS
ncbi:uridine kinase [Lysinibacillus composti]|uniref:Uridine kinase n=2 Tax=Lysinibacillus composti TaxID=720633 RepID=A0A3N9UIN5_9BACI|nr:uridine kinase [Lysinibacillus composti]